MQGVRPWILSRSVRMLRQEGPASVDTGEEGGVGQALRGTEIHDGPVQREGRVRVLDDVVHVMGHQEHGDAERLLDPVQGLQDEVLAPQVDVRQRFVEEANVTPWRTVRPSSLTVRSTTRRAVSPRDVSGLRISAAESAIASGSAGRRYLKHDTRLITSKYPMRVP